MRSILPTNSKLHQNSNLTDESMTIDLGMVNEFTKVFMIFFIGSYALIMPC